MSLVSRFLDDREKSINPAHLMAAMLVVASIGWVTFLVVKNHIMPELSGVAQLLGGTAAVNAVHKAEDLIDRFKTPLAPPPPTAFPTPPPMVAPPQ